MTLKPQEIFQAHINLFGSLTDFAKFQITSIWLCKGFINCQSPEEAARIAHKQESLEPRALAYRHLLRGIGSSAVLVTLHDDDESSGFIHLDVFAPDCRRLNKSKQELLGFPIDITDPKISEPKAFHIKKALANGQCEKYIYTYQDDFRWRFNVNIIPTVNEAVIAIVTDAEAWQAKHWLNKV
jgi:hypothetical protein